MADLYRLIIKTIIQAFLALIAFSFITIAHAENPIAQYKGEWPGGPIGDWTTSNTAAAGNLLAGWNIVIGQPASVSCGGAYIVDDVKAHSSSCSNGYNNIYHGNVAKRFYCQQAATTVSTINSICPVNCPTGQTSINGQCVKSEGCQAGLPQKGSIPFPGDPVTVCFSGCEADIVSASNQYYCTGGNQPEGQCTVGTWVQTGNTCSAGTTAASPPPPESNRCAAGTCPGTINGVFTCLACTQNNTTTETDTSTKTNADGSTSSTTSTTQCQGDACTTTTTTTTTPVGGGIPTIESETKKADDKKSFCEENPTFSACKEGTFTGSCGSPPACTGDAIQCATARATFETNCTLNPAPSSLSDLGNSVASGTENLTGATLSSAASRDTVDLATSLDTSKFLAAGCPADRVITLANGFNLTLPFNSLCTYLEFLGSIVTAFSLLAASRIVGVT